jgi:hypothetical protein
VADARLSWTDSVPPGSTITIGTFVEGEMPMTTSLLIRETETFEITRFKKPHDIKSLKKNHVAFSGSPRKHPYDPYRIILMVDPGSNDNHYLEFNVDDISFVEELPNIVTLDEEVIPIVRLWVRRGSIGIRSIPFWVEDLN